MGICTWAQMESMAQQFFCTSLIEPDGSAWFEPLLEKDEAESHDVKLALAKHVPLFFSRH